MLKRLSGDQTMNEAMTPTFQNRTDSFWEWFSSRAEAFHQAIENRDFSPYTQEVSDKMAEIFPGFAWVFGPGENDVGHFFTISPEGNPYEAILITHLVKNAPQLDGWTFYDSRQPSPTFDGMKMKIADKVIEAKQIWVTPSVDIERELISLVCWNPLFADLSTNDRSQITFLWLDESIGEFQVENRIGSIGINDSALADAMPLTELPEFILKTETENNWERRTPGLYYTVYKFDALPDYEPAFLRSDIAYGTSLLWQLARDYKNERGEMNHPLPELGVEFLFIAIPHSALTAGKEVDERVELEDAIDAALPSPKPAICLGGATGSRNIYIDLLVIDGDRGISSIRETLKSHPLGQNASLHYFDKGKAGKPIS